jgi:hypothetical protein
MSRPKKPVVLKLLANNIGHRSEADLRAQIDGEISFGDHNFEVPEGVLQSAIALREWNKIIKMIVEGNISFITTADTTILSERCQVYADLEYAKLDRATGGYDFQENNKIESRIHALRELLTKMDQQLLLTPVARISRVTKAEKKPVENPLSKQMFGD